jgi:hypothetical protein
MNKQKSSPSTSAAATAAAASWSTNDNVENLTADEVNENSQKESDIVRQRRLNNLQQATTNK